MNDLITVIINVFNAEKYISKCLSSVINQTYSNLDILIINDGSTDNTLNIVEKYKDKRIRIINQKNQGLSIARNVGIVNAKGKYIYFIDADDYIEKDTIEYLYRLLIENNTRISVCGSSKVFNYIENKNNCSNKQKMLSNLDILKMVLLSKDYMGTAWNKLIDKSLFKNIRFPKGKINDVLVMYKLYYKVDRIIYGFDKKYYYYMHDDSIVNKRTSEYAISMYYAFLKRYDDIKKIYPNLVENEVAVLLFFIDLYIHNNDEIVSFLKKEEVIKKYKKMFKLKYLKVNISFRNKIKLILFRISPVLCINLVKGYLKFK